MRNTLGRRLERGLFDVRRKLRYGAELTDTEREIMRISEMTMDYLDIYDKTERTNRRDIYYALYLSSKNHGRTLQAIAYDVCCDVRSLERYRERLMEVFAYIAKKHGNLSL